MTRTIEPHELFHPHSTRRARRGLRLLPRVASAACLFLILGTSQAWAICGERGEGCHLTIRNRVSGLCLGVRGVDQHAPGTGTEAYHCNPDGSDQGRDNRWKIVHEDGQHVMITNAASGLCLGVRGLDNHTTGTEVEAYHCNSDSGQDNRWKIVQVDGSHIQIRNKVSNLCLGVRGVDGHNAGTGAEVYHCNPGGGDRGLDNQWRIAPEAR